ncbi:hypothetical protein [Amycolatopsis sp. NPDC059657]|uniref:hypothetical protein n=1 Tax=Amycolatopsis sp. NPDC059657 TaxID=3346899 RepID=UPI00366D1336
MSDDERPRKDRTGELVEPDEHDCDDGWLDRDADPMRPCLICKPHLAPSRLRAQLHGPYDI